MFSKLFSNKFKDLMIYFEIKKIILIHFVSCRSQSSNISVVVLDDQNCSTTKKICYPRQKILLSNVLFLYPLELDFFLTVVN